MAYFNHAFTKLFIGTHATQAGSGTQSTVSNGFLSTAGVPSVNLITTAAPYKLGLGVYGWFDPKTYLSVNASSTQVTTGAPLILASTALYSNDKIGTFHGGYQESTKSKTVNPKYVSRFYRVDPCLPNPNVIHVGNTPFTKESGIAATTITTAGSGYLTNAVHTGVTFTGGSGTGAVATLTIAGGAVTAVVITNPGTGYQATDVLVPLVGSGSPALTFTPGTAAALTITVLTTVDATCCKEFLCDEQYSLRIDIKGSPELRYLSRNGYWNTSTYTGCCPANCGTPVPIDSTLVFIAWAQEALANKIIGPFINFVVYDEKGVAWYAPGNAATLYGDPGGIDLSPGVGTVTFTAGSGYVDGTYSNVSATNPVGSNGVGALFNVTVAGGIVTAVTVVSPGMSYHVGQNITGLLLPGGTGATISVATLITPTWDNYVSPGHTDGACAGMKITGAYIDTKFGDCTFYPSDFFEKEPVKIFASLVNETGDECEFGSICVVTQCQPRQGMGFGETVLRDLILSESYMQNYFNTSMDLRIREVTQGYDISNAIIRSALYTRYYILHSVPRFNNPSGVFDNDQYMIEIITNGISSTAVTGQPGLENFMATWLTACSCSAVLEIQSCGAVCGGTACPTITLATPGATGVVGTAYTTTNPVNNHTHASGGNSPYTYEITSGILPIGLSFATATGNITGTPTTLGSYTFTVTAADQDGCDGVNTFTIVIS